MGWILGLAAHRRSHPNGGCAYGNPVIAGTPGGALVVDAAVVGTARLCVLRQVGNKRLTGFDQRAHRVQVGGTKAFARFKVSIFDELIPTDGKPAVWMARTVDAPELLQS